MTSFFRLRAVRVTTLLGTLFLASYAAFAWNTPAMNTNALQIETNGGIRFTLFDHANPGQEFSCGRGDSKWLVISACGANDLQCMAAVNRMTSMLITAKATQKKMHVQNNHCDVTQVALKP